MGTDDDVFIEILTTQSRAQIQAIKHEYERANNMSLKRAIEKETSGSFEKALIALLAPSVAAYTAQALHEAFSGVGTVSIRIR
jgi:Annexin